MQVTVVHSSNKVLVCRNKWAFWCIVFRNNSHAFTQRRIYLIVKTAHICTGVHKTVVMLTKRRALVRKERDSKYENTDSHTGVEKQLCFTCVSHKYTHWQNFIWQDFFLSGFYLIINQGTGVQKLLLCTDLSKSINLSIRVTKTLVYRNCCCALT